MKEKQDDSAVSGPKRQALLPEITRLAGEGLTSREIAEKLGIGKTTVNNWLRWAQGKPAKKKAPNPGDAIREEIASYRLIFHTLFDAWRRSQADKQTRLVEQTGPAGEPAAKEKKSIRSETRTGDVAYLAKAMAAEKQIGILQQYLAALEGTPPAESGGHSITVANLSDDELEKLTPEELDSFNDDQLFAINVRLRGKHGPSDLPLLTNEDLRAMTHEELTALETRLGGGIEITGPQPPASETQLLALAAPEDRPHTECEEYEPPPSGPVENPEKADAPPLTWDQQRRALLHEKAERKRKLKRFTDPNYCAYRPSLR